MLAIQNFGSSGSKFIHALLDSHPHILAIPTLYMMYYYDFWGKDIKKNRAVAIDEFIRKHLYWFDPKGYSPWGTDKMGPNRDEVAYVEKDVFKKNLNIALGKNGEVSRKLFFKSLYVAYSLSIDKKLEMEPDQYILLYPYHTSRKDVALELTKDFPNTYFLHCFREIIQTLGSTAKIGFNRWGGMVKFDFKDDQLCKLGKPKLKRKNTISTTTALIELSIFLSDRYIANLVPYKIYAYSPIINEYKSSSRAIKLEDLVENPNNTLLKLCQWLNIPWNDELLKPTYNGKTWWNRPESAKVTGFSKIPLARKHGDIINNFDRYRLEIILSKLKKKMGYSYVEWNPNSMKKAILFMSYLIPLKIEFISMLPSKYSFYHNFNYFSNKRNMMKSIIKHRSFRFNKMLNRAGIKGIRRKEFRNFFHGWFMLIPIRSYINVRLLLFKAHNKLLEQELEVVDIL